jgi:hypothetical protein
MKALQAYVDGKNKWNAIFQGEQFELKTAKGRQRVADALDCDLSPENLTCDGELSRAQVQKRWQALNSAALQLQALDPAVTFYELSL